MYKLVLSAFALAAMTSAALAEPVALTDTQMDGVTAAGHGDFASNFALVKIDQDNFCAFCLGIGFGGDGIDQENEAEVKIVQDIEQ